MEALDKQKTKLEQKKARMQLEETKLKLKERKMRTRSLIEKGGLVIKAGLDHLETNTLYGALLSLKDRLEKENDKIITTWKKTGSDAFDREEKTYTPVILKFNQEPTKEIRDIIRTLNLRWNKFRQEWYGNVQRLDELKKALANVEHNLEILNV